MAGGIAEFLTVRELHKLERLLLRSRYVVEGNLSGAHKSPQRGASSEFAEHRHYLTGDNPKHIDWRVLGRTDRYFVKRYEDETNLRVYLLMDRSGSMGYGSAGPTKYRYACHLAAALGYVVVKARDSVGLFLHSDRIDARLEAANTFFHLNDMLKTLGRTGPGSTTSMAATLHDIAESVRKRALIVMLSDLFDEPEELSLALAHFRRQHHDVIVFHVLDPAEIDFPFKRGVEFEDMETAERIAVNPRALARNYAVGFGEFLENCRKLCADRNVDYRLVRTDQPVDRFVRGYLEERRRLSK